MLIGLAEQGAAQSKVKRSVTVNARPSHGNTVQTLNNTGKIVFYKSSLAVLNYIEYTLEHHLPYYNIII